MVGSGIIRGIGSIRQATELRPVVHPPNARFKFHPVSFSGSSKYLFFFLENALKKTTICFLKFLFYLKVQSFRLIMKNNFIQMVASAGHAVAYTIGSIFNYIIDCVQLYFTNSFTNIVL